MKAITIEEFGNPDVLKLSDVPDPLVRPADLLVRVYAAGVNRADLTHRTGGYGRPDFGDSPIIGLEIAGEVIEKGNTVVGFEVGDRVMGVVGGGAYAELARIDYRMAMPIPAQLDYVHAAAIPEVFVTAHEALMHLARLKPGDSVLIHAAAGGVGSAAVQLAYATGATVYATTDGSKLSRVEHLGADVAIDYKNTALNKPIEQLGTAVDANNYWYGAVWRPLDGYVYQRYQDSKFASEQACRDQTTINWKATWDATNIAWMCVNVKST